MYPKARLKTFTQNILKRPKKPLIIILSHDLNSNDHSTEVCENDSVVLRFYEMQIQEVK